MSVFTYDPNPPRVSSPWLQPETVRSNGLPLDHDGPIPGILSDYSVTRLPPEPQEGPVEYKLHLLLRPRRAYQPLSYYSASLQFKLAVDPKYLQKNLQKARIVGSSTAGQTRQDRCQHLTTQLLWRLRQSSPYHASVAHQDIVVPLLPDDDVLVTWPVTLGRIAPGLEESRGALYEIGVADDGALVGIIQEEMDQSIATLRWMAANLGCTAEVQRIVAVGECLPTDQAADTGEANGVASSDDTPCEKLWVAEVFVRPHLVSQPMEQQHPSTFGSATADQLRVTLTGPTGSGKSTLLGTLSTGALDDGHGKSRLNSLRHRHEMVSGLTSTVTQELLGYTDEGIVNYANPNIESWIGIHDYTKNGRLVFVSDSAGHPRFRRTTLRGLVGWAPHWTLLCLAAVDGGVDASDSLALNSAHLELCLQLKLPLAIILTKSDLLNKELLKRTLVPIWTAVKSAGRTPQLLQSRQKVPENIRSVPAADDKAIRLALLRACEAGDFCAVVPVVLCSTVSGDGIGMVHALLRALPLPPPPTAQDFVGLALNPEEPASLFHIEDRFSRPASYAATGPGAAADPGYVVSGYLRFGRISVGDQVVLGPFPADDDAVGGRGSVSPGSHMALSMSHPSGPELARMAAHNAVPASTLCGEWHDARVVSIRNLRLPVERLAADQVGTIGLIICEDSAEGAKPCSLKPRRGMVLAIPSKHMLTSGLQLQAASGLTALFADPAIGSLALGTHVTFYVASVRSQARICKIWSVEAADETAGETADDGVFALHDSVHSGPTAANTGQGYHVRLELLHGREWIELGSQIVILEGASREAFLLDGFIGKVVEIEDR